MHHTLLPREIWLLFTSIGGNRGLAGDGGFAGRFRDKAILVKFPHLGFGNSTYLV
jgi:hypothetical protein